MSELSLKLPDDLINASDDLEPVTYDPLHLALLETWLEEVRRPNVTTCVECKACSLGAQGLLA